VRAQRAVFGRLNRRLIANTIQRYLSPEGPVVEIGAGDGQLKELLPDMLLSRVTHTEPDAALSWSFRARCPNATLVRASAETLPFESGSAAAVLGLCVLDVVTDGPGVVRELSRVLQPGGSFMHWLDMSTVLDAVVDSLWELSLVPFPNWFSDPSAAEWPEDLALVPRERLLLVVNILRRAGVPIAELLAQYLTVFSWRPRIPGAPTAELIQLQESATLRDALNRAFELAFQLADGEQRARFVALSPRPLSSARIFENRLREWFSEKAGFRIAHSGVDRTWEVVPLERSDTVYRSCCVGEQRHLSYVPEATALLCREATSAPKRETLVELGVFTFVATRL